MGVHGLWNLLEPSGKAVPLETLENKVLAVDVSIWLHQLVKGFQDSRGNALPNAHLLGLFHRVCKLLFYKIKPVFVFDGDVPLLKKQTVAARQRQRGKLQDDAHQARQKLAKNILKHTAVKKALGTEATKHQLDMAKLRPEADMFELPPMEMPLDEWESEGSEIDDLLSTTDDSTSPEKEWNIDLHSVDVNCEAFKSLPADVRHDILTDLKETRKQSSWARLHEMPEESNEFSTYQMDRLLKRRNFQVSLEETQKEMGGKTLSLGDLDALLKDQGVTTTLDMGKRIASDSATRYIYVQEAVKKAMTKPSSAVLNSPAFKTPRNTVMQSSRTESKTGRLDTMSLPSENKVGCDNEDKFESDWTSDSGDDESKPLANSNVKDQPKSRVDIARDFMFVASALTHEQIHTILEKRSSPQKAKKDNNVNNSSCSETNVGSCGSSSQFPNDCMGTSPMELEYTNYDPGPSTSRAIHPVRLAVASNFESEIDYIGIISDESESDEELDTVQDENQKPAPLEIVIQCDKEYKIEEDMFADVFYMIEDKLKAIHNNTSSDKILKSDVENTINLQEKNPNRESMPRPNIIRIDQVRDAISLLLPKSEVCHEEIHLSDSDDDNIIPPTSLQLPEESRLKYESGQAGEVPHTNSETNQTAEICDQINLIRNNSLMHEESQPCVNLQDIAWDSIQIPEISQHTNVQSSPLQHNEEQSSFLHTFVEEPKEVRVLNKAQPNDNTILLEGNEHYKQTIQSASSRDDDTKSLNKSEIPSKPVIGTIPLKENDISSDVNTNVVLPNPPLPLVSNQSSIECENGTGLEPHEPKQLALPAGTTAYFPSSSKFTTKQLQGIQAVLESQHKDLLMEQGKKERMATNITAQMSSEAQELLRLFGLPYIVAPMEAEAQCAFLDYISLTDGTISDDSDIWLFGGQKVYKNFFNQKKHVMQFTAGDIRQFFKLARHQMILLALLTGSDYTTGVPGVGPVTALEILAAFPSEISEDENVVAESLARGLRKFQEWFSQGRPAGPGKAILRNKLKNLKLHEGFPSIPVIEAYLRPTVDLSEEKFTWALPDLDKLREFAREKFGWTRLKTDEILLPVMNKLNERISQKSLHSYFQVKVKLPATDGKLSKRVQQAVNRIGTEETLSGEEDDPPVPVKKVKRKSISEPKAKEENTAQWQRGRGRGRGKSTRATKSNKPIGADVCRCELGGSPPSEVIPQRERDRLSALKNKLKAIELFRKSKSGLDQTKRQKFPRRIELAKAKLSESDSDD